MKIWYAALPLFLAIAGCSSASGANDGFEPFIPPATDHPAVDGYYLQEFNHTTNELEPGIGALVSVLIPPAGLSGFETPTQVTPRGLVTHDDQHNLQIVEIDAGEPDLVAAAFCSGGLVLAGPENLYFYEVESLVEEPAPTGLQINGLASGVGRLYLLTSQGLGWALDKDTIHWPAGDPGVTAAFEDGDELYTGGDGFVAAYPVPSADTLAAPDWTLDASQGLTAGALAGITTRVSFPQTLDLVVAGSSGVQGFDLSGGAPQALDIAAFAQDRVPLDQPTSILRTSDGGILLTTRGGACRLMDRGRGPEWRVYNAERWLPDEDVRTAASDADLADGPIYFATAGGLASVTAQRMTLEQKLEPFVERIVARHDRDGAVADSHLTSKGDLSTNIPWDSDNDGGWTCYWILAECFRYKVTGDPAAKAHFDKSLDRMLSFRTLTGTDYFVARSVIRKQGCQLDDCDDPDDGEWFASPDGEWWVKGDTSNDEVTSHMFMMGHAYDLCADEDQRRRIREHVDGIGGGIVDHGYQLVDVDGKVTTYGQFDPAYVNDSFEGQYGDGGHRSAQMIAILDLAYYMTGKQKYLDAEHGLIDEHHYDQNIVHESEYPFRAGSGDGDELVTQAFFILLRYEQDPALRAMWLEGWRRTYSNIRLQQGAFWDITNAVLGGEDPEFENAARWLRLAPVDMIRWNQHNSQRRDLAPAPDYYHDDGRMRTDGEILPYDERRCDRWNTDQFRVDGGMNGMIEMDGADVLEPYWMGRYYGFIVSE